MLEGDFVLALFLIAAAGQVLGLRGGIGEGPARDDPFGRFGSQAVILPGKRFLRDLQLVLGPGALPARVRARLLVNPAFLRAVDKRGGRALRQPQQGQAGHQTQCQPMIHGGAT